MTTSAFLTGTAGNKISYSIEGTDGPWMILMNSLATDRRMWDPQVAAFSAGRRVLRFDARGHGQSDVVDAPYSFYDLADDVVAMMDTLGIETADWVGLSMGGMTTLAGAIRHPTRVRRAVCCDARADAPDAYKAIWDGFIARVQENGVAVLCDGTLERWFTESFRANPANKSNLDMIRGMIAGTPATGYIRAAECLRALDLLPHLGKISVPTHFVGGEVDPAAPVPVMQGMADATPGGKLTVIAHAAHLANIESPAAFTDAVLSFLNA